MYQQWPNLLFSVSDSESVVPSAFRVVVQQLGTARFEGLLVVATGVIVLVDFAHSEFVSVCWLGYLGAVELRVEQPLES